MDWLTVAVNCLTAIGGTSVVFNILGARLLEKQRAKYSKDLAEAAHERSVLLAQMQNSFSMGATSHMAAVAFDKHIDFCQEYVDAISKALQTQMEQGLAENVVDTREFFKIRQKWALWLTHAIETKLDLFEVAVEKIAAGAQIFDDNGSPMSNERSIKAVISALRELLRTEELTALRSDLVLRSLQQPPRVE